MAIGAMELAEAGWPERARAGCTCCAIGGLHECALKLQAAHVTPRQMADQGSVDCAHNPIAIRAEATATPSSTIYGRAERNGAANSGLATRGVARSRVGAATRVS